MVSKPLSSTEFAELPTLLATRLQPLHVAVIAEDIFVLFDVAVLTGVEAEVPLLAILRAEHLDFKLLTRDLGSWVP